MDMNNQPNINTNFNQTPMMPQNVQPQKNNNKIIFIIIAIIAIAVIIFLVLPKDKKEEKENTTNSNVQESNSNQEPEKPTSNATDKLGFILSSDYKENKIVAIVEEKDVATSLTYNLDNNIIQITNWSKEGSLYFKLNNENYDFKTEEYKLVEEDGKKYLDKYGMKYEIIEIIDNNYIVQKDDKYFSTYVVNEENKDTEMWTLYTVTTGLKDSIEDCKNIIEKSKDNITFCSYKEDIKDCVTYDNKKINSSDYKLIEDSLAEQLKKDGLNVKENNYITGAVSNHVDVRVENDTVGSIVLMTSIYDYAEKVNSKWENFKMNGNTVYLEKSSIEGIYSYYLIKDSYTIKTNIVLNGLSDTKEQTARKIYTDTFSK